jgi:ABC-type branched-subunit amino acid transport system permease subunit
VIERGEHARDGVAFLIGNAVIGIAGAVYGMMNGFVTPNGSGLGDSLLMLSIIVLGGLGNFWGAVVAAMVILVIPEKLQAIQEFRLLIFALLVLGILLFRPSGILPRPIRDLSHFIGRSGVHE